jgi:hypothetical protein
VDLKLGSGCLNWIHLAQDRDPWQWWISRFVKYENFLTSWTTVRLRMRTLFRGVSWLFCSAVVRVYEILTVKHEAFSDILWRITSASMDIFSPVPLWMSVKVCTR